MIMAIIILSEVKERQISYDITYMQNLKNIYIYIYKNELILKNRKRLIDSETELMLTRGKKIGGGIDWEFGVDMYTSLFKQIANKGLIYSTRSSAPYSVIT